MGEAVVIKTPSTSLLLAFVLSAVFTAGAACSSPEGDGAPAAPATPAAAPENAAAEPEAPAVPTVIIETSRGDIRLELDEARAPVSVGNFLAYVDAGHYDGTVFHRVIDDFMIQGGGFDAKGNQKPTRDQIKNEADNGLKNKRGTVAMARTNVVDSATAQFFINHKDNDFLDFKAPTTSGYGYAVFGKVVEGMDVVDAIATSPTENKGGAFRDAPREPVIIESIRRVGAG